MKKFDWLLAFVLGAVVVAMEFALAYPALHPSVWGEMAVAAGLQTADSPFPALWRAVASLVFTGFGTTAGLFILGVAGKVLLGVMVVLVYYVIVSTVLGFREGDDPPLFTRNLRWAASLGALGLGFSEPAWRAAQNFSPDLLFGFLVLLVVFSVMRALDRSAYKPMLTAMFVSGMLIVENPLGILLLFAVIAAYWRFGNMFNSDLTGTVAPDLTRSEIIQNKWRLLFAGLSGLGVALIVMIGFMVLTNADTAHGLGDNPARWALFIVLQWKATLFGGFTSVGFMMLALIVIAPGVTLLCNMYRSLSVENQVGFGVGALQIAAGGLALTQLMGYAPFWASNWGESPLVTSPAVLIASVIFCSVILGLSTMTWGLNRAVNNRRGFAYELIILMAIALCALGRGSVQLREALAELDEFADLVLDEAKGSKLLVSDGHFDEFLRLKIDQRKQDLPVVFYMANGIYRDAFAKTLTGVKDSLAVKEGVPSLLMTWVRENRCDDICLQMGFECWKRNLKPIPPAGGVSVRTWASEAERQAAVEKGKAFGEKLMRSHLASYKRDRVVLRYVEFALWRLARIASRRAEQAAVAKDDQLAAEETELSERLESVNASACRFRERLRSARSRLRIATPDETMHQALNRGDYALASIYAQRLVEENPKNASAWFAMAMNEAGLGELVRAEEYLSKYLQVRPNDPVVLNNRAMVRLSMGKYKMALADAEIAYKKLPQVPEIRNTLMRVKKAIEVVSTNGVPDKVPLP